MTFTRTLKKGCKGDDVKALQTELTKLGYLNDVIDGDFGKNTLAAVKAFQKAKGLEVDGLVGPKTAKALFPDETADPTPVKEETTLVTDQKYAQKMDWWTSDIQKIFAKGVTAQITDVLTGLTWKEQRRGGTNHADVQPCTAADTANLKKAYGGKWKWDRRAIWVTINGVVYAASMNGMPHGGSSIKNNNFDGHHCIHFTNSRTHCSNKVCNNHKKAIEKAATTPLK